MFGAINTIEILDLAFPFSLFYKKDEKIFYTSPEVFNPYFFVFSSIFFAKHLVVPQNSMVLDLGTGSGILAIFAADRARKVIATDINPYAIRNARINSKLNKLSDKIIVRKGSLFRPIKEKFDTILFNPPYFPLKPKTYKEAALFCGPNYLLLRKFLANSKKYLNPHGFIQLSLSSYMNLKLIQKFFKKYGFRPIMIARKFLFFEILYLYLLIPS
jgi:release factor glutamine methyltransferase